MIARRTISKRLVSDQKGQILPLFMFFFVMIFAVFLISHNVGRMATRRIELQVAADTAAMSGAHAQALGFEILTSLNDMVSYHMAKVVVDLVQLLDPATFLTALEDIIKQVTAISDCHGLQTNIGDAYLTTAPVQLPTMLMGSASTNSDVAFALWPIEKISVPQLRIARPWWLLWLYAMHEASDVGWCDQAGDWFDNQINDDDWGRSPCQGTAIFDPGADVLLMEKVTAFVMDYEKPIFGSDFLGGIQFPKISALGSASPYWVLGSKFPSKFGEDPRDPNMNFFAAFISMMLPGPFWSTHLVETGDWDTVPAIAESSLGGVAGLISGVVRNRYAWAKLKGMVYTAVQDQLRKKLPAGPSPKPKGCFST